MSKIILELRKASGQNQNRQIENLKCSRQIGTFLVRKHKNSRSRVLLLCFIFSAFIIFFYKTVIHKNLTSEKIFYVLDIGNIINKIKLIEVIDSDSYSKIKARDRSIGQIENVVSQNIELDPLDVASMAVLETQAARNSDAAPAPYYAIQVGSYLDANNATSALGKLKKNSYPSVKIIKYRNSGKLWYRVNVGEFGMEMQARNYLSRLQKDYGDSYIVKIDRQ